MQNDPQDWLDCAHAIISYLVKISDSLPSRPANSQSILGIGVAFTSCTVLPVDASGTPVCHVLRDEQAAEEEEDDELATKITPASRPHAFPKLWKHHSKHVQVVANELNARLKNEPFLNYAYGGKISLEWFHPKVIEVLQKDRPTFDRATYFLEAGDWLVWRLSGTTHIPPMRSACQASFKGLFNVEAQAHYLNASLLTPITGQLDVKSQEKLFAPASSFVPQGTFVGQYNKSAIKIAAAMIDAHAAALYLGCRKPNSVALLLGTSGCYMVCSSERPKSIPGIAGVALDGIAPHLYGIEAGSASVGDSFAWLSRLANQPIQEIEQAAMLLYLTDEESADSTRSMNSCYCIDFFNGNRTPLMRCVFLCTSFHCNCATPTLIY